MIPQRHKLDWNSNRIPNLIDNATSSSYGNLIGSANTATIVTTKVGTFSSMWYGSGTLYFDPGDGGAVEPLVLTTGGVAWNHSYLSAGSKTIRITGDLGGITRIDCDSNNVTDVSLDYLDINNCIFLFFQDNNLTTLDKFARFVNLNNCYFYDNDIVDIKAFAESIGNYTSFRLYLYGNPVVYPPGGIVWKTQTGNTKRLNSIFLTSDEVDQCLIDLNTALWSGCIIYIDGTNPAPTAAAAAALAGLSSRSCTVYTN